MPVLTDLGVTGDEVLYVGDTDHDRHCAADVGATFALAGWNPRTVAVDGELVLRDPAEVLDLLG